MTNFVSPTGTDQQDTAGNVPNDVAGAPNGAQMQGNPAQSSFKPFGVLPGVNINPRDGSQPPAYVPNPVTAVQAIASGQVSLNVQPTNVLVAPGGDSLLAQLSRGQTVFGHTSYGLGNNIPVGGGVPPVGNSAAAPSVAGINGVSAPNQNYTGN